MTRYTVLWDKDVETQFIDIWIAADSETRAELTKIANWVDENLAIDPEQKGQERPDLPARVLAIPISAARASVVYQVLPDDRQVRVVRFILRK